MNDEIDEGCECDCCGSCSLEQAMKCHRAMLQRMNPARVLAQQVAKLEEDSLEAARAEARRLTALVIADPHREIYRIKLQRLLASWPTERTTVDSTPPIARSTPAMESIATRRSSRFFMKNGESWEWETGTPAAEC